MVGYKPRLLEHAVRKWTGAPEAIIIKGPRQAGKTTLLKHFQEELGGVYYTFDDPSMRDLFSTPERVPTDKPLFLDEIQLLPNAGAILKWLVDMRQAKLYITGSGAFHMKEGIQARLVGRSISFTLYPLILPEIIHWKQADVNVYNEQHEALHAFIRTGEHPGKPVILRSHEAAFNEYLTFGGYPRIVLTPDEEMRMIRLRELFQSLLEHDIFRFFTIHDTRQFEQFVTLLLSMNASIITLTKLPFSYQTVQRYLSILVQNYLFMLIPPYHTNRTTEVRKQQKLYAHDPGFLNLYARPDRGSLLETFAAIHLRDYTPRYWRTRSGAEVDFIIEHQGELLPIEIKQSGRAGKSFYTFLRAYKPRRALILSEKTYSIRREEETGTIILTYPLLYL